MVLVDQERLHQRYFHIENHLPVHPDVELLQIVKDHVPK
jgi:hypothetical protein